MGMGQPPRSQSQSCLREHCWHNLCQTRRLILARHRSRRGRNALKIRGALVPGLIVAILIVSAAMLLDRAAGEMRGQWPGWLHGPARLMTDIGLSSWYLIPAALVLLVANLLDWRRAKGRTLLRLYNWTGLAFFLLLSVGLSGLMVTILKQFVGRARPYAREGAFSFEPFSGTTYASFPSGHSTTIGAVTAVLFLFLPRLRPILLPLGIWLALTRIVVGAHFPSDVIAGFSLGFGFAVLMAMIFAQLGYVFRCSETILPVPRPTFFL